MTNEKIEINRIAYGADTYSELQKIVQEARDRPRIILVSRRNFTYEEALDELQSAEICWGPLLNSPQMYPALSISRDSAYKALFTGLSRELEEVLTKNTHNILCYSQYETISDIVTSDLLNPEEGMFKIVNAPKEFSENYNKFMQLEQFCERYLGSFKYSLCSLKESRDEILVSRLFTSKSEAEAIDVLKSIQKESQNPFSKGFWGNNDWEGLDITYPNLEARMVQIKEFQKNWFPGEFIKASEGQRKFKLWIKQMKGGNE